jgi:hypothetical protein
MSRDRQRPQDLYALIDDLRRRIEDLERMRRLANTSIDSGELVVKGGNIVVRQEDGTKTLEILHGTIPAINMYPIGDALEDFKLVWFGWESELQGAAIQIGVEKATGDQDGGKLLLMQRSAFLALQRSDAPESYLSLGSVENYPEHFFFKGRWMNNIDVTDSDALVVGQLDVAGGATSVTFTYAVPKLTPMVPLVTLECTTVMQWQVTASSETSFTVDWSNDAPAKKVNFWAFRI